MAGRVANIRIENRCQTIPFTFRKRILYEGGIREPLINKMPGITKAGSNCDYPVISMIFTYF